jgi:type II secretory pathway component PulC
MKSSLLTTFFFTYFIILIVLSQLAWIFLYMHVTFFANLFLITTWENIDALTTLKMSLTNF